jgi:hypothetical protein
VQTGCDGAALAPGEVRAKVVECADELVPGPMAAGRIGDLVLENAHVRVVIRGLGDGYFLHGTGGGAIVDAAPVGGEDLLQEIVTLAEFAAPVPDELVITEAGDDGPAEIVMRGPVAPVPLFDAVGLGETPELILQQTYRLAPDDTAVEIHTRFFAAPDQTDDVSASVRDLLLMGGRVSLFVPGEPEIQISTRGPFVASSGVSSSYGVAYGADELPVLELLDLIFFKLAVGPTITTGSEGTQRWLVIGDGSVASVTERAWQLRSEQLGTITGSTSPGASVELTDSSGDPITVARADTDGAFRAVVPPGQYDLRARAAGHDDGPTVSTTVTADASVSADAPLGPGGAIHVIVTDDAMVAIPARAYIDCQTWSQTVSVGPTGELVVPVPPRTCEVTVSRGMEYDVFVESDIVVQDGQTAVVTATVERVLDTAGWISVDTHLHSEMSFDSDTPMDVRLLAVAAEGVEVAVTSEHDFVVDLGPLVDELGLDAHVSAVAGSEVTSWHVGHVNSWPMSVDVDRPGGGTPAWEGLGPNELFAAQRDGDADRLVQLNHPRDRELGIFALVELDADTLLPGADPADRGLATGVSLSVDDFDAIEVANTKTDGLFEQTFADWLAYLATGKRVVATGASDSHGDDAFAGSARTYVWVGSGADDPATIDIEQLNAALRDQRAVVAQSAFVVAGLVSPDNGAVSLPGQVVDFSNETTAGVRIRVQAPPWMPTGRLRIYSDGIVVFDQALDTNETATVRFDQDVDIDIDGADHALVVRVDAGGDARPVFDYTPEPSFTNPLYIDGDGDGD